MVYLIYDIYENIIDTLSDDIRTLKCCSLVCTAFCLLSQKHIFHRIDLKVYDDSHQTSTSPTKLSLRSLLHKNPWIANYVRYFRYIVDYRVKKKPCIPHGFYGVDTFEFTVLESTCSWRRDLSNNFKYSLNSFIHANAIVNLALNNVDSLPITILLWFPHLESLDVRWVTFCDEPLPRFFGNPVGAPKLVKFRSSDSQLGPLQKFLKPDQFHQRPILDMTNLEDLSLSVEHSYITMELTTILIRASQTLKSLCLTGYLSDLDLMGRLASVLSKASLQTLRTLTISPVLDNINDDPYLHLITELDQMRGQNVLERLSIVVQVQTDCRCTTELSRWAPLDIISFDGKDFPYLREVSLNIVIYDFSGGFEEFQAQLEEIGRTAFPRLMANRCLNFDFRVEVEDV